MEKKKQKSSARRELSAMDKALHPSQGLLCKIGSALVHADEYLGTDGREIDRKEFRARMDEAEVQQWIKDMGVLLPLKRMERIQ